MGSLTQRFTEKRNFSSSLDQPAGWLISLLGGSTTQSGVQINEFNALRISAVFACVRVLAETMAAMPLDLYKTQAGKNSIATDHPIFSVLHDHSNEEMTAFQFRESLMTHLTLWGNAYAYIQFNNAGYIDSLWPLMPWSTYPWRDEVTGKLVYYTTIPGTGELKVLPKEYVLHIPGLSYNGITGLSVVGLMRESLGITAASEAFAARFFGNGTNIGGVLTHPGKLSKEAKDRLRNSFDSMYKGLDKSHRVAVFEEGMKYEKFGMPLTDAQFLESRQFQVTDIARMYRIPPHMIGDLSSSTNNNIEHQGREFATNTMMPWCVRWEQVMNYKLLAPNQRKKYYTKFDMDELLRGDLLSRYQAYSAGINNGFLNPDGVCHKEDMDPLPNGQGQTYRWPLNTIPADMAHEYWKARMVAGKGGDSNGETNNPGSGTSSNQAG
jgi:HK97 family phage portal protein